MRKVGDRHITTNFSPPQGVWLSPEHVLVLLDGTAEEFHGLVDGALQATSGGILVASAIEEAGRHLVAWEVVDATQGELDKARVLGVLADEGREAHALYLKGHIDNTLGVAVLHSQPAAFLIGEGHEGGVHSRQYRHLDIQEVAHKAHAVGGGGPEDIAVDAVLVDTTRKEVADAFVDDATGGGIGEGSGVGHHTGIEACCLVLGKGLHLAHLPKQVTENLAGGAHLGIGNLEVAEAFLRVEMMVCHNHEEVGTCHTLGKDTLHAQGTRRIVHIAYPKEVGLTQKVIATVGVPVVSHNVGGTWHPLEEVGETVGDNNMAFLAKALHPCRYGKGAAEGIAIGVDMTHADHVMGLLYIVLKKEQLLGGQYLFHNAIAKVQNNNEIKEPNKI